MKWAVNKKILNQIYQLKAFLYETSLQGPELKHSLLYTFHQKIQVRPVKYILLT